MTRTTDWASRLLADTSPEMLPHRFWRSMPENTQAAARIAMSLGLALRASGSRLFCPSVVDESSDWDVFTVASIDQENEAIYRGFKRGGSRFRGSFYLDGLNLICFSENAEGEYRSFAAATAVCELLGGPKEKTQRVAIFEAIKAATFANESDGALANLSIAADAMEEADIGFSDFLHTLTQTLRMNRE